MSGRKIVFALLVCAFLIQTTLVYTDRSGYAIPRLTTMAQSGKRIWHKNNCQSCHQLYGFGGFLGPDLTNAMQHLADERLQSILSSGQVPMPAFHFGTEEIQAIAAFLSEMDATGTGQYRATPFQPDDQVLNQVVTRVNEDDSMSETCRSGFDLVVERKCIGCHLPNPGSTKHAPDLCDLVVSPGESGIATTLQDGRAGRGMPQFQLSSDELDSIISFLHWMHENRQRVHREYDAISAENDAKASIPWFEYDR